jgi:hypothetical protein
MKQNGSAMNVSKPTVLGARGVQFLAAASALLSLLTACGSDDDNTSLEGSAEIDQIQIETGGFVFDALAAGPEGGEPVLLLHGFPSSNWQ